MEMRDFFVSYKGEVVIKSGADLESSLISIPSFSVLWYTDRG